jgi:thymidylate synthase (FAD)
MINVVLEINTTRDIARQILRHRSFSFQEFSQRYADPSQLGFEVREARLQDKKNRQNSIDTTDDQLKNAWEQKQQQLLHEIKLGYKWAIENGIAKEQARAVLPEGLTKSRLYMNGNLRSWITYVALREGNGTQKEHREVAMECKKILIQEFAFLKNSLGDVGDEWSAAK